MDEDLLSAARKMSPEEQPRTVELDQWIASLPGKEKDQTLLALLNGDGPAAAAKLMHRYLKGSRPPSAYGSEKAITLASLRAAAAEICHEREAAERARRERERARREAGAAREREEHIRQLMAGEERAWNQVEEIVRTKQAKSYADAVKTLQDLREVAVRKESLDRFTARVRALRDAHKAKYTFIEKLDRAGLVPH